MNDVPANRQAALLAPFVTSLPLTGLLLSIIPDGTKQHKRHEGKKRKSTFWKYDMKRHPASTAVPRRMVAASSIILVQS
ncbi:hypothetical protein TNCT_204201 [Trichonephila clavata]|uniref:Uncharacterized protein n=1 Tax=Trichonephila clavata TaxID=2740835 RepID=A0A8X6LRA5_TRICU|nr:hypothetical protein TNCT_204201 [Trichonephila clavata]